MFFEDESAAFSVADVLYLKTDRSTLSHTNGLPCHALTLRKKADSCLFYNDTELKLSGKSLLFVPTAFAYSRRAAQEEMIVIHFWSSSPPAREPTVFPLPNSTIFDDLFDELYRVWKEKEIGYRLKAGELLFSILYQITLEEHANTAAFLRLPPLQS